jgi:hypothetical protein
MCVSATNMKILTAVVIAVGFHCDLMPTKNGKLQKDRHQNFQCLDLKRFWGIAHRK